MNLTMSLLSTRRALPKQRIRRMVEAYQAVESDEAFDRMFERDKEELRALGIPLVTEDIGAGFDDEQGYRIDQRDYALPDLSFTADELAVIGLASRTWAHAAMAGPAAAAWRKVAAAEDRTEDGFVGLEPQVGTEPAFDPLKDAVIAGRSVSFDYTRGGEVAAHPRRVDPWSLTSWRGRWYLTGHDLDRDADRIFRLSRITGAVAVGAAATHQPPAGFDPQTGIARLAEPDSTTDREAVMRVRVGAGHGLRRRATEVIRADDEWDQLRLGFRSLSGLADDLASYGPDVIAEAPPELRAALLDRFVAMTGSLASTAGGEK